MAKLRIYTNESVHVEVAEGLKRRGIEAWSARDAGNLGLCDVAQLEYANREKALIFTHDRDFLRLASDWLQEGKDHFGIIYVHQYKFSIGEYVQRLMDYALILEAEDMQNHIDFL